MNNNASKWDVFLAILGAVYIVFTIVSIVLQVGTVSEAHKFTWFDGFNVFIALMVWHWCIDWIKELF